MLSLLSSLILNLGEIEAKTLSKNLVSNQARKPQGGDTDQIRAVGAGECGVALTNSYYLIRLMRSNKPRGYRNHEKCWVFISKSKIFLEHMSM